eukprot:TRINITY_DN11768_c1_g1_i1.p1 TRINITY_DN11768_c1_g1~~TRINITY_DN11768_c1_g1_i1.p1  ORF type:complete len:272 (+),score=76.16 TRINITY_DN11768_c1_g1_i1:89-904(+)
MKTSALLVVLAAWCVSSEKVGAVVGDVKIGEKAVKAGEVLEGLVFNERQRINVAVPVTDGKKPVTAIEQAAIRFTHTTTGKQVWFQLEQKTDDWSVSIDMVRAADASFDYASGKYTLAVVISDPSFKKQTERDVAVVTMDLTATPLYRQRMEFSEMKDWVRREPQKWDMRPDEDRGSAFAAMSFSAAYAVPVLVLFAMLFNAGINVKGLFANPATFLRSFIFQGAMCAICAVMVLYWISLPLFPALILISSIGVVAFVFRPRPSAPKEKTQ